jgi:fructose/tagatose bisphosphate aldolase
MAKNNGTPTCILDNFGTWFPSARNVTDPKETGYESKSQFKERNTMPIITDRKKAQAVIDRLCERQVPLAIFCSAAHWNTEAILLAAKNIADRFGIERMPIVVAMTFQYPYMPQAKRITHCGNARIGFISMMEHLKALTEDSESPYRNLDVLPHLDHADPNRDKWALTEGLDYLASVMFDTQKYPLDQGIAMTRAYVAEHGSKVLVEGIIEELTVSAHHTADNPQSDTYIDKALRYLSETKADFLVADLGTEQQSSGSKAIYLRERAVNLTRALGGKSRLVLHGTSSLTPDQMGTLGQDGVIRVNTWTRIVREAGQYAAARLCERKSAIDNNDFEACESRQYLMDSTEKAAEVMAEMLGVLKYEKLA